MSSLITGLKISGITLYPVKSFAGIQLDNATLTRAGLMFNGIHDRTWAITKTNNHVLTQRQHPKMALIHPRISEGNLFLYSERAGEILLPPPASLDKPLSVTVWKDNCPAHYAPQELNEWLMYALESQEELKFVAANKQLTREFIDPSRFATSANYFSDAAPFLVCNKASLSTLNQRLTEKGIKPVDMRRFRSNIVVEGLGVFEEHQVERLCSTDPYYVIQLIDHCQRCIMTTVDPDIGEFSSNREPFLTLSELNNMPNKPKAPVFCVNARLAGGEYSNITVGDQITAN